MRSDPVLDQMQKTVAEARDHGPFVPSITNIVTVNPVVNAQIGVGGSPAVFYQAEEGESFAPECDALYINLGTLIKDHETAVPATIKALDQAGKPWLLDPVGIGKGRIHQKLISFIKDYPPTIIKGNATEIIKLASAWGLKDQADQTFIGVDSKDSVQAAKSLAVKLARFTKQVVVISGPKDFVTDGNHHYSLKGGSALMGQITGAGCMLAGVMAVYLGVAQPLTAALTACTLFNQASQAAAQSAQEPASFQTAFLDLLYSLSKEGKLEANYEEDDLND